MSAKKEREAAFENWSNGADFVDSLRREFPCRRVEPSSKGVEVSADLTIVVENAFLAGCRYEATRCAEIASEVSRRWDKMSDKGIADLIEGLILQRDEEERA